MKLYYKLEKITQKEFEGGSGCKSEKELFIGQSYSNRNGTTFIEIEDYETEMTLQMDTVRALEGKEN